MQNQDTKRSQAVGANTQHAPAQPIRANGSIGPEPELSALPYRLKRLALLIGIYVDRALKEHGIGRSQWQVLSCLVETGELSQRELQTALLVEPATLTGIVDVLVGKGWVERSENVGDRRVRMVKMTREGKRRFSTIDNPVERVAALMLEGVSDAERGRFSRTAARMIANLERETVKRCKAVQDDCTDKAKD